MSRCNYLHIYIQILLVIKLLIWILDAILIIRKQLLLIGLHGIIYVQNIILAIILLLFQLVVIIITNWKYNYYLYYIIIINNFIPQWSGGNYL
jgi:hypothetical protein